MDFRVCTPTEFLAADFPTRRKLVLAQIDAEPELWEQRSWSIETACGTAYCFGGWAVVLAGGTVVDGRLDDQGCSLSDMATLLLGLDPAIEKYIYATCNDRQALDEFVELANEADRDDVASAALMIYVQAAARQFCGPVPRAWHRWPPLL